MKPVIIINRLTIKPGRGLDNTSAVLVSVFASASAQDEIRQSDAFKAHVSRLQPLIESSTPSVYEEAYTTGEFR
jgi:hypothetical protein